MLTKLLSVVTLPINCYLSKTHSFSKKPLVISPSRHTCVYTRQSVGSEVVLGDVCSPPSIYLLAPNLFLRSSETSLLLLHAQLTIYSPPSPHSNSSFFLFFHPNFKTIFNPFFNSSSSLIPCRIHPVLSSSM